MPHLMAQVRIPRDTALPEDVSINTFHFAWDNVGEPNVVAVAQGISDTLEIFYLAIDNLLSAKNANPVNCRVYRMDDPEPRSPVLNDNWGSLTYATTFLPSEVAVCLSFQGVQISGEPQARRRGRVYLGPMGDVQASDVGDGSVAQSVREQIGDAAGVLLESLDSGTAIWSVYSVANDDLVPVDNGWVDNAFDTIRSRGMKATVRTLWDDTGSL